MTMTATSRAKGLMPGVLPGIILGGSVAGVLDILWAFVSTWLRTGYGPPVVLKAVASGLLGTHAFFRGTGTALLGLVLHFCIAFLWTGLFAVAALLWEPLMRHAVVAGLLYGAVIFAVMHLVVLPLSAFPRPLLHQPPIQIVLELAEHMLLIGLVIALSLRWLVPEAAHG